MLREAGIQYDELVLNRDYSEVTLRAVAGRSMVPQVFINGEHVGGSDELEQWFARHHRAAA
jgi:glutaredoxin